MFYSGTDQPIWNIKCLYSIFMQLHDSNFFICSTSFRIGIISKLIETSIVWGGFTPNLVKKMTICPYSWNQCSHFKVNLSYLAVWFACGHLIYITILERNIVILNSSLLTQEDVVFNQNLFRAEGSYTISENGVSCIWLRLYSTLA